MNFSAALTRPSVDVRLRSRLLGATAVGVLVAVGLGVAARPAEVPAVASAAPPVAPSVAPPVAPPVARPAAVARVTAVTTSAPAPVATVTPGTPGTDRVPSRIGDVVTAAPPATLGGEILTPAPRTTLARSRPTRVHIPAIDVDSALVGLGLQDDGRMEVPPGAFPAGWYTGAPTPGELGPAILAGHVDYGGAAGVFHRLRELEPGDAVEVTREDGTTAVFRVTRVEQHAKDAFPTASVYGDIDHAGIRLITCGGSFDRRARSYEDNIVVFARLDAGGGNS